MRPGAWSGARGFQGGEAWEHGAQVPGASLGKGRHPPEEQGPVTPTKGEQEGRSRKSRKSRSRSEGLR